MARSYTLYGTFSGSSRQRLQRWLACSLPPSPRLARSPHPKHPQWRMLHKLYTCSGQALHGPVTPMASGGSHGGGQPLPLPIPVFDAMHDEAASSSDSQSMMQSPRKALKRKADAAGLEQPAAKKRKVTKADKNGLRLFSMRVLEKVKEKGSTTYDDLVDDLIQESGNTTGKDLNIRRRVYDALNVLRAMNIISKHKKQFTWIGLPTGPGPNEPELRKLQMRKLELEQRIKQKDENLMDLVRQYVGYSNLLARNASNPERIGEDKKVYLPFILVNTRPQAVIDCEIAEDRQEYFFSFNMAFQMHDDTQILKKMGLYPTDEDTETAKAMLTSPNTIPRVDVAPM